MIETWGHQRHQMDCRCLSCKKEWIEEFKGVPKNEGSDLPTLRKS